MIKAIQTAILGILANQVKAQTSAKNIAHANTPDKESETTKFTVGENGGVNATAIPKNQPFVPSFDPNSPFANEDGYVNAPNTNLIEEALNISEAQLAIEANAKILSIAQDLSKQILSAVRSDK